MKISLYDYCGDHLQTYDAPDQSEVTSRAIAWEQRPKAYFAVVTGPEASPQLVIREYDGVGKTEDTAVTFEDGTPLPPGWRRLGDTYTSSHTTITMGETLTVASYDPSHTDRPRDTALAMMVAIQNPSLVVGADGLYERAKALLLDEDDVNVSPRDIAMHDAAKAILGQDGPLYGRARNDRLMTSAALEVLENRVKVSNNGYDFGQMSVSETIAFAVLGTMLQNTAKAKNFLELAADFKFDGPDQPATSIMLTVQYNDGQTPGAMIKALKAEIVELNARIKALKEQLTQR